MRDGILNRGFYFVCEFARADELRSLLARPGCRYNLLHGRQLRNAVADLALSSSPVEQEEPLSRGFDRRHVSVGNHLTRALHLGR